MSDCSPDLDISPAALTDKPIIERLVQLYLHDFSGLASAGDPFGKVDDRGRFAYAHLDRYWQDGEREALLFRLGGDLAGFALVNAWSASGLGTQKAMAEFFVLRKYRRAGLGTRAAIEVIQRHPVSWEIAVAGYNQPALQFWSSVTKSLHGFEAQKLDGDGVRWCGTIWRLMPRPGHAGRALDDAT